MISAYAASAFAASPLASVATPPLAAEEQPSMLLVIALMALGGILVGGAWSVRKRSIVLAVVMGLAGLMAVAAAILQQVPA